jgi:hypothetical protein
VSCLLDAVVLVQQLGAQPQLALAPALLLLIQRTLRVGGQRALLAASLSSLDSKYQHCCWMQWQ